MNVVISVIDAKDYGLMLYLPMKNVNGDEKWDSKILITGLDELLSKIHSGEGVDYGAYFAVSAVNEVLNYEPSFKGEETEGRLYDFVVFALKFALFRNAEFWENYKNALDESEDEE